MAEEAHADGLLSKDELEQTRQELRGTYRKTLLELGVNPDSVPEPKAGTPGKVPTSPCRPRRPSHMHQHRAWPRCAPASRSVPAQPGTTVFVAARPAPQGGYADSGRDDMSQLSVLSRAEASEYSVYSRGTSVLSRLEQRLEMSRRGVDIVRTRPPAHAPLLRIHPISAHPITAPFPLRTGGGFPRQPPQQPP